MNVLNTKITGNNKTLQVHFPRCHAATSFQLPISIRHAFNWPPKYLTKSCLQKRVKFNGTVAYCAKYCAKDSINFRFLPGFCTPFLDLSKLQVQT